MTKRPKSRTDAANFGASDFRVLGRYVTDTNEFWDFQEYVASMIDGTFEFDDVVRQPYVPDGPIEIDCKNSHRVGAMLILYGFYEPRRRFNRRPVDFYSKIVQVTYTWSHTGNSLVGRRYETYASPIFNGIVSDGLTLTRKDRVDGILSLSVKFKHEVIYETSFKLSGCEDRDDDTDL